MATEVPISNFSESAWYAEAADDGVVYWNGSEDPQAQAGVELLRGMVDGDIALDKLAVVSETGNMAVVRKTEDLAVKHFRDKNGPRKPEYSGIPYLRASVAMQEGLDAIRPTLPERLAKHRGVDILYTAPTMYAAYVPREDSTRTPLAVMSLARGTDLTNMNVARPNVFKRREVYKAALVAAGLRRWDIICDFSPQNTLLHQLDQQTVQITRLDVFVPGWSSLMNTSSIESCQPVS